MNNELKRITQSRKDFVHHSGLFGLTYIDQVSEALAMRILKNVELHTIIYDSRQVIHFALGWMQQKKDDSKELIKNIDTYLNTR